MDELKNNYMIKSNNLIYEKNQPLLNDMNNYNNKQYYTGEENMQTSNEDLINYGTNTFNNKDNVNPENNQVNQNSQKNTYKNTLSPDKNDKICFYIKEIKDIDNVVPFCQEKNRKEKLLDRGLLLCLKVNEIMEENGVNIDDLLNNKKNNIDIDKQLLDENYWMNQKVDKYARTEQRQRIPQERWFMIKDNSFTPNLNKCFALNRGKFIDTYNWLNSLENKQ